MKEKTREHVWKKWCAGYIFLFTLLTMLVSGCAKDAQGMPLDELLGRGTTEQTEAETALQNKEKHGETQAERIPVQTVWVHICGEVEEPGIYELPVGSRVYDGLVLAGGFTEAADTTYYNLATILSDGMKIEIPARGQKGDNFTNPLSGAEEEGGLVNINTATPEQLQTLPGIGASRAADIIAYREKQGGFKKTSDIMKVSGIKEATYEKIKEMITVE